MGKDQNEFSSWQSIKSAILDTEEKLIRLSLCNIWVHKKVLHKFCKVTKGVSFGQRKSFNYEGSILSKWRVQPLTLIWKDPQSLGSNTRFFRMQLYSNGHLRQPTYSCPKYFRWGDYLTNTGNQNKLVGELVGAFPNLLEDVVERRQQGFAS